MRKDKIKHDGKEKQQQVNLANEREVMTEKQAAEYMGFTPRALQQWRYLGNGPRYIKISTNTVRYFKSELVAWLSSKQRRSTSE